MSGRKLNVGMWATSARESVARRHPDRARTTEARTHNNTSCCYVINTLLAAGGRRRARGARWRTSTRSTRRRRRTSRIWRSITSPWCRTRSWSAGLAIWRCKLALRFRETVLCCAALPAIGSSPITQRDKRSLRWYHCSFATPRYIPLACPLLCFLCWQCNHDFPAKRMHIHRPREIFLYKKKSRVAISKLSKYFNSMHEE